VDFKDVVRMALDEYLGDLRRALDGLTAEERRFQPAPESHHVDFAVWHMARVEDSWVQRFARGTDTVWQSEGWDTRFGIPARDSGFQYTSEQVAALPDFDLDEMMAYFDSVRRQTLSYLNGLSQPDLESCPDPERRPGYTVARMLAHLIVEEAQHTGQVAYIRGIQRGLGR
jgi:uncharacterized damage-inducible protein DinB